MNNSTCVVLTELVSLLRLDFFVRDDKTITHSIE